MYAVIETGGKQYRVEVGTELEVELLDVEPGQAITLERVLLVADGDDASIGRPLVENAAVDAEVLRRERGEKLISFKYRPKARSRVKKGHRQELTVLRITDVRLNGKSAAEAVRKAEMDAKTERQRLEEAAAKQAAEDAALAARLAVRTEAEEAPAKPKASRGKTAPKAPAKEASAEAASLAGAAEQADAPEETPVSSEVVETEEDPAGDAAIEAAESEAQATTPDAEAPAEAAATDETTADAPEADRTEKSE
jgi:large subunit ribosomal protein L21